MEFVKVIVVLIARSVTIKYAPDAFKLIFGLAWNVNHFVLLDLMQ